MSVACLDLKYSVSFRKKKIKDEKKDSTSISLAITQDLEDEEEEEDPCKTVKICIVCLFSPTVNS